MRCATPLPRSAGWLRPVMLLVAASAAAAAGGGGTSTGNVYISDGKHGPASLTAEAARNVTDSACAQQMRNAEYHATYTNGGRVACKALHNSRVDNQVCTRSHECTTCGEQRCLFCLDSEKSEVYSEPMGNKFLFVVVSLLVGALVSTILETMPRTQCPPFSMPPPFTVVMFLIGACMGWLSQHNLLGCAISDSVNAWKYQDPHSILFSLLPPLLFESAFNVNYHVFTKVWKSSLMLAGTGVCMSTFITGCVAMGLFGDEFDLIQKFNRNCDDPDFDCSMDSWFAALMFGAIVSATDPVAVVAVLQTLGAQPKLSHMIEGESLLNDGSAVVIFLVFKGLVEHKLQDASSVLVVAKVGAMVLRLAGGAVIAGLLFSYVVYAWMRRTRNLPANIEISVMVLSVYAVFYLSEHWLGASGVLATVMFGLNLAKHRHLAMTPGTEEKNEVVWEEIAYLANGFTFALAGVILRRVVFEDHVGEFDPDSVAAEEKFERGTQFGYAVALYFILFLIRLLVIYAHYPLMVKCTKQGYQVEFKEALFMTFSGLRGAVSLCVALFVEHMALPQVVKDVIIFHVCMVVFCTVVINGMTASWVYKQLKLGRQGSLSSKIDFQTIQTINEQMVRFIKGPVSPNSKMVALSEHWFHGNHNTCNSDTMGDRAHDEAHKRDGLDLVCDMLTIEFTKKAITEQRLISKEGKTEIQAVDVVKLWNRDVMRCARREWRKWSLTRHPVDQFSEEDVQHVQDYHYLHVEHMEHMEAGAELKRTRFSSHTPFHSIRASKLERTGITDIYNIYLTALRARYTEEKEELKLTATTCDYLQRALAAGADHLKQLEIAAKAEDLSDMGGAFWANRDNCVIWKSHQALVKSIDAFDLDGVWYRPPMHKIQIMAEAYFAEYEAHEEVQKYLHRRLHDMTGERDYHERIRDECREVAEAALDQLSRRNLQQHPLMAPIHTFLAFREGYLEMKRQLREEQTHGLLTDTCAFEIRKILDHRQQDLLSVLSNDGIKGQYVRLREWWFRTACEGLGGRPSKYRTDKDTEQAVEAQKHAHRSRLRNAHQRRSMLGATSSSSSSSVAQHRSQAEARAQAQVSFSEPEPESVGLEDVTPVVPDRDGGQPTEFTITVDDDSKAQP